MNQKYHSLISFVQLPKCQIMNFIKIHTPQRTKCYYQSGYFQ